MSTPAPSQRPGSSPQSGSGSSGSGSGGDGAGIEPATAAAVPTAALLTSPTRTAGVIPAADQRRGSTAADAVGNGPADFPTTLRRLIRARFPLLSIQTAEESRVLAEIAAVLGDRAQVMPAAEGLRLVDVATGSPRSVRPEANRRARRTPRWRRPPR